MTQIHVHCLGVFREIGDGFDVDVPNWFGPGPAGSYVAPWKFPDFKEAYPGEQLKTEWQMRLIATWKNGQ